MEAQSTMDSFTGFFGAALVLAVLVTLAVAIAMVGRTHFAKRRATRLVVEARNLLTIGIFDRDEKDNPGPAELLGEAYRLQKSFGLKADLIGLRDDKELDELINRAIRGNSPVTPVPASEIDTLPEIKVQTPNFADEEDELTNPDFELGDRVAAAHKASEPGADDEGDEYLRNCADMAAGLPIPTDRKDVN